jgi:hypothetical protein
VAPDDARRAGRPKAVRLLRQGAQAAAFGTGDVSGDGAEHTAPDVLTLAIERAVHDIERELARHLIRFSTVERIAIERVLEQLADDVPNRRRFEPW